MTHHRTVRRVGTATLAVGAAVAAALAGAGDSVAAPNPHAARTPIQHLVVIFQENVSFDHYFGTYPNAFNTDGQHFSWSKNTPRVNGLSPRLLQANPNGVNPRRYDPANVNDVLTCDQDHDYADEQAAFDGGRMDKFPQTVGNGSGKSPTGQDCVAGDVMNYYDGNTVTALWNYAQRYAMSDNSYGTTFGPSSPGAINLASGDTGNVDMAHTANSPSISTPAAPDGDLTADGKGGYSLTSDAQPYWDDCSTRDAVAMKGKNIGDVLNSAGLSWGWFEGGFRPTTTYADALSATGHAGQPTSTFVPDEFKAANLNASVPHSSNQSLCNAVHAVGAGLPAALGTGTGQYGWKDDYIPHHEPFQYYASTANPHHLPPSSVAKIGKTDQANHQYDLSDFWASVNNGTMPAVSYLKAAGYQLPLSQQRIAFQGVSAENLNRAAHGRNFVGAAGVHERLELPIGDGEHPIVQVR